MHKVVHVMRQLKVNLMTWLCHVMTCHVHDMGYVPCPQSMVKSCPCHFVSHDMDSHVMPHTQN